MLKEVKNTKIPVDHVLSNVELDNKIINGIDLTLKNPFTGYSKVKKGYRFKSRNFQHNPLLSPAPPDEWIENSPSELTSKRRKEFHTYLEVALSVKSYQMHPVCIPFTDRNGVQREYKPLFLLNYWMDDGEPRKRKSLLADIWSNEDIRHNQDWFLPAWFAAHHFAQYKKLNFRVFRDSFFLSNYFHNIQFIKTYRWLEPDEENWKTIDIIMKKTKSIKVSNILDMCSNCEKHREDLNFTIWTLVAMGCLEADWNQKFDLNTKLWSN